MDRLLTIGSFAERCGLSRSALRFYDQCGLLFPAGIDEATGYRYYTAAQVQEAVLIRHLREAEMPVAQVRAFLASGPQDREAILDAHASRVRDHAAALEHALERVHNNLAAPRALARRAPSPSPRTLSPSGSGR